MSLIDAITSLGGSDFSVIRRATPTDDGHGRTIAGAPSTFTITASIQPSEASILVTADNRAVVSSVTIYTADDLRRGDIVTYQDEPYEVLSAPRWDAFGDVHVVAQAALQVVKGPPV